MQHASINLGGSRRRSQALSIALAGVAAAKPDLAVAAALRRDGDRLITAAGAIDLAGRRPVVVIGAGKAAAAMGRVVETALGPNIVAGLLAVKDGHELPLSRIEVATAAHPVPDRRAPEIGRRIRELISRADPGGLLIALFSGGGSALMIDPIAPVTIADLGKTTDLLLRAGADITELNTVRKHLSATHAGRLAQLATARPVLVLAISDVLGDRLDTIASGPFFPDPTTWSDTAAVIERYDLGGRLPDSVRQTVDRGRAGDLPETPKPGAGEFVGITHQVIGNLAIAAAAARSKARSLGLDSEICDLAVTGPADLAARRILRAGREKLAAARRPFCLIFGGETVVAVTGGGSGGRCQHLALAAACTMSGDPGLTVLAIGTDGTDGPTDAAGAFADCHTLARGRTVGLEAELHLRNCDSYRYLAATGDLVKTGPTLTNVNDLILILGSP